MEVDGNIPSIQSIRDKLTELELHFNKVKNGSERNNGCDSVDVLSEMQRTRLTFRNWLKIHRNKDANSSVKVNETMSPSMKLQQKRISFDIKSENSVNPQDAQSSITIVNENRISGLSDDFHSSEKEFLGIASDFIESLLADDLYFTAEGSYGYIFNSINNSPTSKRKRNHSGCDLQASKRRDSFKDGKTTDPVIYISSDDNILDTVSDILNSVVPNIGNTECDESAGEPNYLLSSTRKYISHNTVEKINESVIPNISEYTSMISTEDSNIGDSNDADLAQTSFNIFPQEIFNTMPLEVSDFSLPSWILKSPKYSHSEVPSENICDFLKSEPRRKHSCRFCKKDFRRYCALKSHVQHCLHKNRGNHNKNKLRCELCRAIFISKRMLRDHSTTHIENEKFECCICEKTFFSRLNLRAHTDIHLRTKSFFIPCVNVKY